MPPAFLQLQQDGVSRTDPGAPPAVRPLLRPSQRGRRDRWASAAYRDRLLAGLSGRVIEIGAGNGLNFAHYPSTVSEVVAIEPERCCGTLAVDAAAARRGAGRRGAGRGGGAAGQERGLRRGRRLAGAVQRARRAAGPRRDATRPAARAATLRFFEHGTGGGRAMSVRPARSGPHGVAAAHRRLPSGPRPDRRAAGRRVRTGPVPAAVDAREGAAAAHLVLRAGHRAPPRLERPP